MRRGFPLPAANAPAANPISARQGSSLATLLKQNGYLWNEGDGTTAVAVGIPVHELHNNAVVRLIGPSTARLQELRAWWLTEMRKLSYRGGAAIDHMVEDAYEMLCASARQPSPPVAKTISTGTSRTLADVYLPDESPTNGSSIATVLESDGKRVLFLGDAWAEDIAAELRRLQSGDAVQLFDAIKVSHHGSSHNTSVDLLSLIDSPIFLVSSSGSKHNHPHFEVLAEIVDRPATFKRTVYFNYETPASKRLRAHTSKSGAKFDVAVVQNGWIHI